MARVAAPEAADTAVAETEAVTVTVMAKVAVVATDVEVEVVVMDDRVHSHVLVHNHGTRLAST